MMIPLFKVFMNPDVNESLIDTVHSGWIGQGDKVKKFEESLYLKTGNLKCLTLSAGTHGLHLALRLAGIGKGDEVITTPLTCTATNWPILMQGADIVWADVNWDLNIDPEDVKRKITNKTKAIICVHWGGYPCDMKELYEIAQEHNLILIEDAAHAFGSYYMDKPTGCCQYSDFTMFSFQAIKHLTTIDGGALLCRKDSDYRRGKLLRWYGIDREVPNKSDFRCEDQIHEWGYKYHMNDVCATVGLSNIQKIDWILDRCQENVKMYLDKLEGIYHPACKTDRASSNWLFTIFVNDRINFVKKMQEAGIVVSRVHERNDKHNCVKKFRTELPRLDKIIKKMICIPCGWWVEPIQVEYITTKINEGW